MRLLGLEGVAVGVVVGGASEDRQRAGEVQSVDDNTGTPCADEALPKDPEEMIVVPHDSPMKKGAESPHRKACISYLGQERGSHTSPRKPHPQSPGSKALDRVLSRIASLSPGKGGPDKGGPGGGAGVRRNLSREHAVVSVCVGQCPG